MEMAMNMERCGCSLMGDPLRAVYSIIAKDHTKLKVLADILSNTEEAVPLAIELTQKCSKYIELVYDN